MKLFILESFTKQIVDLKKASEIRNILNVPTLFYDF